MAPAKQDPETKTEPATEAPAVTAADVAAALAKASVKVTVQKRDKDGAPLVDPKSRTFLTEEVTPKAAHVLGFRVAGDKVIATLSDGQRAEGAL